jgi:hypothetical protein
MENISRFAQAAKAYGLSDAEIFQTVDLYEKMNLHQVTVCLFALGRKVNYSILFSNKTNCILNKAQKQGLRGLGPKESEKNERTFSQETINQGNTVISTQYGYNKGATQSGIVFGNTRHM